MLKSFSVHKKQKIFAITVIVVAVIIYTLLPLAAEYSLTRYLKHNGAEHVEIESITYNPFLAKLTIEGLNVTKGGVSVFSESQVIINARLISLLKKNVHLQRVYYQDLLIDVEQFEDGAWRIGSLIFPGNQEEKEQVEPVDPVANAWRLKADNVGMKNCTIHLKTPAVALDLWIDSAELLKFSTQDNVPSGRFSLLGTLNGSPVKLYFDTLNFLPELLIEGDVQVGGFQLKALKKLLVDVLPEIDGEFGLEGKVVYRQQKDGRDTIEYDGMLELSHHKIGSDSFLSTAEKISWYGTMKYLGSQEGALAVKTNGKIKSNRLNLNIHTAQASDKNEESPEVSAPNSYVVSVDKAAWQGMFQFSKSPDDQESGVAEITEIELLGISADVPGSFPLLVKIPSVRIEGLQTSDLKSFRGKILDIGDAELLAKSNGEELISFKKVSVESLSAYTDGQISFDSASLLNLLVLKESADPGNIPLINLSNSLITGLRFHSQTGLLIDSIEFSELHTSLIRKQDGNFSFQQTIEDFSDGTQENLHTKQKPEEDSSGIPLTINEIVFSGKNTLHFEDNTLTVPFKTDLEIKKLHLLNLDSSKPDQETDVSLEGTFEKRAPLQITGKIFPFNKTFNLDINLELRNYPLASLSSYTVQSVGTALASGQLRVVSNVELNDGVLDAQNRVILQKLETKKISEELAKELDNKLPVSLDTALSILRDSEDNITLDIPVKGPASDLGIGVADVLITGLSKAIVPAASSYLVYALGPYAALAYVGMKVGEKMLQIDLPPVTFMEGDSHFDTTHDDYLVRVSKILKDYPDPDLQICPEVVLWEFLPEKNRNANHTENYERDQGYIQKLNDLGQQRAAAIKDYLIGKHGIKAERLLLCETKIEKSEDATPQVKMHLSRK